MVRCETSGSAHTVEILLVGHNNVFAVPAVQKNKAFPKHSGVRGIACTDCGAIFGLKLKDPEKLKPFAGC